MKFNQYLGKYVCGYLSESDYPELALEGILEGYDSKYLGILAAMKKNDEIYELRKYLKWSLEDLNIELPTKRNGALLFSSGILDEILDKKKDIIKGISEIKNDALFSYDFYSESKKYCMDSIGFEHIEGLFDEYYETLDKLRVDKKYLREIKSELLIELKKWKTKLKTLGNNG